MLRPVWERSATVVTSVKRLCPCRNLSVLNSCSMCSQWRHLLHSVLLTPIFNPLYHVYNVMTVNKEETVSVNLPRPIQNILYMFFFGNPINSLVSPSTPVRVLYYRSSSTLQGKVGKHYHPTCYSVTEQNSAASISGLLEQEFKHVNHQQHCTRYSNCSIYWLNICDICMIYLVGFGCGRWELWCQGVLGFANFLLL